MRTIYLMRHGLAVDLGERDVQRDADRMLSAEGIRKTEQVMHGLCRIGCRPDAVVSSPLLRAAETAAMAARHLTPGADVAFDRRLAPGCDPREVAAWLGEQKRDLMLVGHMPDIGLLASLLLAGDETVVLCFKKAAVCSISFTGPVRAGEGRLDWLLQPQQARRLRKAPVERRKA